MTTPAKIVTGIAVISLYGLSTVSSAFADTTYTDLGQSREAYQHNLRDTVREFFNNVQPTEELLR